MKENGKKTEIKYYDPNNPAYQPGSNSYIGPKKEELVNMKLTKTKLLNNIRNDLEAQGYREIKDTITGAEGLFIKIIEQVYFLSLGLTISSLYDSKFTASFYLSRTTRWSATWGDIPEETYARIGRFLTTEERKQYLDSEYNGEGIIDSWWNGDQEGFRKFSQVVKIAEPRFLQQDNLFLNISASKEVKKLEDYVSAVFEVISDTRNVNSKFYQFLPKSKVDDIPMDWFKAAETILKKEKGIVNLNTVKNLAGDAWRQHIVRNHFMVNMPGKKT